MALINVPLTHDAKYWWKLYCVHALTIAGAIPPAWAALPKNWQDHCEWMLWVLAPAVAVSGIIGRVIKQNNLPDQPAEDSSVPQP